MSVTYPDLTNDFPDVASDERYLFRDMTIDDVPFVVQYEKLLNALKTAADGATDVSSYQEEWNALVSFKGTDEYKNHVAPLNMTADKFQTIEDKTISSQRFAKRQKQQWIISELQPDENSQAVDDVWFRVDDITDDGLVNATPFYKGEDGSYHEFTVSPNLTFSSEEDVKNIVNGNTVTNPEAVLNNQSLKNYVVSHDRKYEEYKDSLEVEIASVKSDVDINTNDIKDNVTAIDSNKKNIATNKTNISKNTNSISIMQATINTLDTQVKTLQSVVNNVSTSKSGTDIVTSISGGETITGRMVSYGCTFNSKPVVGASADRGEITVTVTRIETGFFEYSITNNNTSGYEAQVKVNWVATAKLT